MHPTAHHGRPRCHGRATRAVALSGALLAACAPSTPTFEFRGAGCAPGQGAITGLQCATSIVALGSGAARDTAAFLAVEEITTERSQFSGQWLAPKVDTSVYLLPLDHGLAHTDNPFAGLDDPDSVTTTYRVVGYARDTTATPAGDVRLQARFLDTYVDSLPGDSLGIRWRTAQVVAVGAAAEDAPPIYAQVRFVRHAAAPLRPDTSTAEGRARAEYEARWVNDTTYASVLVLRGLGTVHVMDAARPREAYGSDPTPFATEVSVVRQTRMSPVPPLAITVSAKKPGA